MVLVAVDVDGYLRRGGVEAPEVDVGPGADNGVLQLHPPVHHVPVRCFDSQVGEACPLGVSTAGQPRSRVPLGPAIRNVRSPQYRTLSLDLAATRYCLLIARL